jgi:hypothetical protein
MTNRHFAKWWANPENRKALSEKRKERYATDPEYRQRVLDARHAQQQKARVLSPLNPAFTTTLSEAATELGITVWKLRHWRDQSWFPEPHSHGKFLYLTDNQVELLGSLKEFLDQYPRLPARAKEELQDLVGLVYANWNNGL